MGLWVHDVTLTLSRGQCSYAICTSSECGEHLSQVIWKSFQRLQSGPKILLIYELWVHDETLTLSQGQWFMGTAHCLNVLNMCDKLFENPTRHWSVTAWHQIVTDRRTDNRCPWHKQYAPIHYGRKHYTPITLASSWRWFRLYQNSLLCNSCIDTIPFTMVRQPSLPPSVLTTCFWKGVCGSIEPCIPRHQYRATSLTSCKRYALR